MKLVILRSNYRLFYGLKCFLYDRIVFEIKIMVILIFFFDFSEVSMCVKYFWIFKYFSGILECCCLVVNFIIIYDNC